MSDHASGESKVTVLILNELFLAIRDIFYISQFLLAMVVHQPSPLTATMGKLLVYFASAKETVAVTSHG